MALMMISSNHKQIYATTRKERKIFSNCGSFSIFGDCFKPYQTSVNTRKCLINPLLQYLHSSLYCILFNRDHVGWKRRARISTKRSTRVGQVACLICRDRGQLRIYYKHADGIDYQCLDQGRKTSYTTRLNDLQRSRQELVSKIEETREWKSMTNGL